MAHFLQHVFIFMCLSHAFSHHIYISVLTGYVNSISNTLIPASTPTKVTIEGYALSANSVTILFVPSGSTCASQNHLTPLVSAVINLKASTSSGLVLVLTANTTTTYAMCISYGPALPLTMTTIAITVSCYVARPLVVLLILSNNFF